MPPPKAILWFIPHRDYNPPCVHMVIVHLNLSIVDKQRNEDKRRKQIKMCDFANKGGGGGGGWHGRGRTDGCIMHRVHTSCIKTTRNVL